MKSFVNIKLKRDTVEGMISTYEFLVWNNTGEDKKNCQKILKALKIAIKDDNNSKILQCTSNSRIYCRR